MGLIQKIEIKGRLLRDQDGIAPIVAGVILLIVSAAIGITALAVYNITQRPDIIYNISNPGFSLAGIDTNALYLVGAAIVAMILLYLWFRPKSARK